MKTVNINIYRIDELPIKSVKKSYNDWLKYNLYYHSDINKIITKFAEIFDLIIDYEYDDINYHFNVKFKNNLKSNLKNKKLYNYIFSKINNYLFVNKIYYNFSNYNVTRISNIIYELNECSLTGLFLDNSILEPIINFKKIYNNKLTCIELIKECLHSFFKDVVIDYYYYYSLANFKEISILNSYYYLQDGSLYNDN